MQCSALLAAMDQLMMVMRSIDRQLPLLFELSDRGSRHAVQQEPAEREKRKPHGGRPLPSLPSPQPSPSAGLRSERGGTQPQRHCFPSLAAALRFPSSSIRSYGAPSSPHPQRRSPRTRPRRCLALVAFSLCFCGSFPFHLRLPLLAPSRCDDSGPADCASQCQATVVPSTPFSSCPSLSLRPTPSSCPFRGPPPAAETGSVHPSADHARLPSFDGSLGSTSAFSRASSRFPQGPAS